MFFFLYENKDSRYFFHSFRIEWKKERRTEIFVRFSEIEIFLDATW